MKILIIAPYYDLNIPGESWSTYKWVEGISNFHDVTVLTCHWPNWNANKSPTRAIKIVNWTDPNLPGIKGRIAWELQPGYFFFYLKARRWIRNAYKNGECFDLAHQLSPLALRYPSPLRALGIPYLIGPLAGSLQTPAGFHDTAREKLWFRKLRALDRFRFAYDPWLKKSYSGARVVIGVAPYVRELLVPCAPARFEIMAETGVVTVAKEPKKGPQPDEPLRLLFVGRIIRTKGIIDAIRALAICKKKILYHFDIVGEGDLLEACKLETEHLGIADQVTFHGRRSRDEVFEYYRRAHVFLFPSFREPSGNVVFEAMSHGLPVITSNLGGPGYVVDESCGLRLDPINPEAYAADLAEAILHLAQNPDKIPILSDGALRRMENIALWPRKIELLVELYRQLLDKEGSLATVSETP